MHLFTHTGEARYSFVSLMNFVDFTVYNAGAAEATNINAGGVDVPAGSSVTATLTAAECLAVCAVDGIAVTQVGASAAEKAAIAVLIAQGTTLEDAISAYQLAITQGNTGPERDARATLDNLGF